MLSIQYQCRQLHLCPVGTSGLLFDAAGWLSQDPVLLFQAGGSFGGGGVIETDEERC